MKETPIPLPGQSIARRPKTDSVRQDLKRKQPSAQPAAVGKGSFKSAEVVVESSTDSGSDSDSDESSSESSTSRSNAQPKHSASQIPLPNGLPKPNRPLPNGKPSTAKAPPAKTRDATDSESEKSSDSSSEEPSSSGTADSSEGRSEGSSSSDIEGSSRSGSEDDDSTASDDGQAAPQNKPSTINASKSRQTHTVNVHPPIPFVPPSGFRHVTNINPSSTARFLDPSNLVGKQIWHITAPASVSISELKELDLGQALQGGSILENGGHTYGLLAEAKGSTSATQLMLPSKQGYSATTLAMSQTYHLHQIVKLPAPVQEKSATNEDHSVGKREQPRGLRTRWRPFGAPDTAGDTTGSDSDVEVGTKTELHKKRKAKHSIGQVDDEPYLAQKKHKKRKEKHTAGVREDTTAQPLSNGIPASADQSVKKKKKKDKRKSDKDVSPGKQSSLAIVNGSGSSQRLLDQIGETQKERRKKKKRETDRSGAI